jgi:hypothetical protein
MNRSTHAWPAIFLFVLGTASLAGCGKQETEAVSVNIPLPSAAKVPADVPANSAAPPASAAAAPASAAAAPASASAVPAPLTALPTGGGASIDGCCAALSAVKKSGKTAAVKAKAATAASVCPGIAKLVKEGKTSRSGALTQIKSALVGTTPPPECN